MNEETVKGKWSEIKGEITKAWGDLTGDDLEKTKGNMEAIGGLITQKYGSKKEEISKSLKEIFGKFENKAAQGTETVKEELRKDNNENNV